MPILIVKMIEGKSDEIKAQLVKVLTDGCVNVLGSNPGNVEVVIEEMKASNYSKGGILYNQRDVNNG